MRMVRMTARLGCSLVAFLRQLAGRKPVAAIGAILVFLLNAVPVIAGTDARSVLMPARFEEDRVYLDMPTPHGGPLHLATDSGGGSLLISRDTAARLELRLEPMIDPEALQELGPAVETGPMTPFVRRTWPAAPRAPLNFLVVPSVIPGPGFPSIGDGILGRQWFAGRRWSWDYPAGQLWLRPPGWRPASPAARPLAISFKTDRHGHRPTDFGRIEIKVDHQALPMLFDTGATTWLSEWALGHLQDGRPSLRATSMIAHSVFERWHNAHPDWSIIDDAQLGSHARMILVPDVEIAGFAAGPVWFTERPDRNFHEVMSSMMSGPVEGAAGGNIFSSLVVSVDYPAAKAWVERVVAK
jgi:hypothetical protein